VDTQISDSKLVGADAGMASLGDAQAAQRSEVRSAMTRQSDVQAAAFQYGMQPEAFQYGMQPAAAPKDACASFNEAGNVGESHIFALRQKYPSAVLAVSRQSHDQLTVTVKREFLPESVEFLYYVRGGWLSVVVGNDERPITGNYSVNYVLSMEEADKCFIIVRTEVDADTLEFPSVTPKVPACVWGERELRDMFGLRPIGLPDERRLVLPDDWPNDLYPLRKDSMDYRYRPPMTTQTENYEFVHDDQGKETTVVPIGPMHITSDEPGHFRLFVEGEDIIDADYRLFYVHRGMEKVAESRLNYDNVTFLTDRICGICGYAHSVAYATSVENALGIQVPERAQIIRALCLEVERLHSHLLNIGLVCHFCGFDTGFYQFFRVRETSMELAELLTGSRKTYGLNLIGGVRRDVLGEQGKAIKSAIVKLRKDTQVLIDALIATPNFAGRTAGVGILDRKVARDYSPVGPTVRGSGYARDTRADHPFVGYKHLKVEARSYPGCDIQSRALVRIDEFFDSLDMIEQLLDIAAVGPVLTTDFNYQPHQYAIGFTEAPRGEDVHYSMLGDNQKLYRWRCKAATYSNWPVLRAMLKGNTIADAPLIVGSIDPCYSCTDRVTVVDVKKRSQKTVAYDQLERYCATRKHSPLKG
jgi:formate hydrogenlyase subunit 5